MKGRNYVRPAIQLNMIHCPLASRSTPRTKHHQSEHHLR